MVGDDVTVRFALPTQAIATVVKGIQDLPLWDSLRRELRWQGQIVKRFRRPAFNQETLLAVFEEEHWPVRVDDPLPLRPNRDPKRCLQDTIYYLNRHQIEPCIRFFGDGTGEGVCWEKAD